MKALKKGECSLIAKAKRFGHGLLRVQIHPRKRGWSRGVWWCATPNFCSNDVCIYPALPKIILWLFDSIGNSRCLEATHLYFLKNASGNKGINSSYALRWLIMRFTGIFDAAATRNDRGHRCLYAGQRKSRSSLTKNERMRKYVDTCRKLLGRIHWRWLELAFSLFFQIWFWI